MSSVPVISLVEMTGEELAAWLPGALDRDIAARVDAGMTPTRATTMAGEQRETSFPGGSPAPGHHALRVVADGDNIGALWICPGHSPERQERFLFIVELDEASRGDQFLRPALQAVERWVLEDGARRLMLSVVGPDVRAQALYEQLGYVVAATAMFKELE